jgi:GNAT superfamily N-acetyltransferase
MGGALRELDPEVKNDVMIRPMRIGDAGAAANLATELGYPSSEAEVASRYQALQNRNDAQLLVAQDAQHEIIGWIHMQLTASLESGTRAEIWGLVVSEPARGNGVGRRLVEAGERWASSMGVNIVVVRSNTIRIDAHGFYEHLGYQVIKTQKAFRKQI